jgi:N-acetylneuraminic acid mutarotase
LSEAGFYNPQSNSWNSILQLPEKKEGSAVCTLNNSIYIIGGNENDNYCKSVWAYCTETKVWESVANLNFPRSHSGITNKYIYKYMYNKYIVEPRLFMFANNRAYSSKNAYIP